LVNRSLLVAATFSTLAACTPLTVKRAAFGSTYEGRYIPARAYEAYARGVVAERDGAMNEALSAYEEAARLDPDGAEPLTRIAAVHCSTKRVAEGLAALEQAKELAPSFAAVHREGARCQLLANEPQLALAEAELALVLAPEDTEVIELLVRVLDQLKQTDRGDALLVATCIARSDGGMCRVLERRAKEAGKPALARVAAAKPERSSRPTKETLLTVDTALRAGDLKLARSRALRAGLAQGELALRALALSRADLALEQARLVALASPDDVAARIAWMLASGADQKQLEEAMQASSSPEALSPLGELLLYEWLTIRVGKLLTLAPPRVAPSEDALLESVNKRVSALFEDQRSRK
jgi:tetratricopeptide (TPR) repeat protein